MGIVRCKLENPKEDSHEFWIFQDVDSGFQVMDSRFFVSGTWIIVCNRYWDSGFLYLHSGCQSKSAMFH